MNIIGIDLGTRFSRLAVLDSIGKPAIVPNADGERITPSVVFFDPDETAKAEIGDEARKQMDLSPDRVIVEAKREMGTDKIYSIGSRSFTPTEISALILKRMIQDAEKIYGKIDEAVITVPANFLETARRATKDAGELAGLKKVTLIDEPVAAAMLYATTQSVAGTALIFDLDEGAFDVTIAKIDGTNVNVVNSSGDPRLGGKDFDRALSCLVNDEYHAKYGQAVFDDKPDFRMMQQAEDIKKTLSRKEMWKGVVVGPAGACRLEISREQFENSISVFVGKIESLVDLALAEAGMSEQDIGHVLLVGGSTSIPCIKALLKKRFGREPEECVNVDEAVALGAAIYAGLQVDSGRLQPLQRNAIEQVNISNVAPANYGTNGIDDPDFQDVIAEIRTILTDANRKWNSRLTSSESEVRERAQEMLRLLAKLRSDLLG